MRKFDQIIENYLLKEGKKFKRPSKPDSRPVVPTASGTPASSGQSSLTAKIDPKQFKKVIESKKFRRDLKTISGKNPSVLRELETFMKGWEEGKVNPTFEIKHTTSDNRVLVDITNSLGATNPTATLFGVTAKERNPGIKFIGTKIGLKNKQTQQPETYFVWLAALKYDDYDTWLTDHRTR